MYASPILFPLGLLLLTVKGGCKLVGCVAAGLPGSPSTPALLLPLALAVAVGLAQAGLFLLADLALALALALLFALALPLPFALHLG